MKEMKYFYRRLFLMLILAATIGTGLPAKKAPNQKTLRLEIEAIACSIDGKLGVAMLGLETREIFLFNGNDRFPMQSVYKFPLALAVLERGG